MKKSSHFKAFIRFRKTLRRLGLPIPPYNRGEFEKFCNKFGLK